MNIIGKSDEVFLRLGVEEMDEPRLEAELHRRVAGVGVGVEVRGLHHGHHVLAAGGHVQMQLAAHQLAHVDLRVDALAADGDMDRTHADGHGTALRARRGELRVLLRRQRQRVAHDGDGVSVATLCELAVLEEVHLRRADEAGDEQVRGVVEHLLRGADLLNEAVTHDDDAVAERHGLDLIVRDPKVFLMDEPLSNLDAKLRNQMRAEIIKLREKIDTTFIYVTHDQVEAMTLGDRIVIMRDGFIQQIGTPQEVFNHPANLFVAGFIGTPQMNFFDATLSKKGDKYVATVQGKDFELPADKQEALKKMDKVPVDIIAGVRPVHIHLSQDGIDAMVDVSELMGSELHLHVNSNGKDVVIVVPTTDIDLDAVHGSHKPVKYSFKPELMHFFDKETEKNLF